MKMYQDDFVTYMETCAEEESIIDSPPSYPSTTNNIDVLKVIGMILLIPLIMIGFVLDALCSGK